MIMAASDEDEVVAQIMKKVGKRVTFEYPGNEGCKRGILKDRALIASPGSTGVPYWDVVDLIEFEGEIEPEWLRIGYYRKPADRLVWGSQTTITEPVCVWKRLLVHAAREMPWFRQFLEEVMAEILGGDGRSAETPASNVDEP
jgi:hypothetical protein